MAVQTQKFLINLDLRGNKLIGAVLGTTVGTANGAIWFDATSGLVQFVDATGTVQSVAPVSYVDATASNINAAIATHVADLTALINAEEVRALAAEAALASSITTETNARIAADATLQSNIDAEAAARTSADDALLLAINNEVARATAAESGLTSSLNATNAEIVELWSELENETIARTAADTALSTRVSDVEADLAALDTTYATDASVQAVAADIAAETSRATAAEAGLQSAITAEAAARDLADSNIQSALTAEVSRANAAEAALQTAIDNAATAAAADVDAEEARALAAEGALDTRVSGLEATSATSTQLTATIDAEVTRSNAYADAAAAAAEANANAHADLRAQGLNVKEAVRTVVLSNGTTQPASGAYTAYSTFDFVTMAPNTDDTGVELAVGDRVLWTTAEGTEQAGIYIVGTGAWTLADDFANDTHKVGSMVFVEAGYLGGTVWSISNWNAYDTSMPVFLGASPLTGPGTMVGVGGVQVNGIEISINEIDMVDQHRMARKVAGTIGNGTATSFTITHDLGIDVVVSVRDITTGELVLAGVICTATGVSLEFAAAPAQDAYRVVIVG